MSFSTAEQECFIIGGTEIYKLAWEYLDKLYITEVDTEVQFKEQDNVVYFPSFEKENWKEASSEVKQADEKNEFNYTFKIFEKIEPLKDKK